MANFALLLNHAPDRYTGLNEDEYMAVITDYVAWVEEMTAKGVYQGGHKLNPAPGRVLNSSGGGIEVHESPFAEVTEVLGGLMIISAGNYDDAVEIASTCPHMVHNTCQEIRQIDEVE
jgi:hypothetical protein